MIWVVGMNFIVIFISQRNKSESNQASEVVTWVVYHLPPIPGNSGWDVNGKRFFWFVPLENSRGKRKF